MVRRKRRLSVQALQRDCALLPIYVLSLNEVLRRIVTLPQEARQPILERGGLDPV